MVKPKGKKRVGVLNTLGGLIDEMGRVYATKQSAQLARSRLYSRSVSG